ncbi:Fbxo10 [Columba livia]|nr:Fbxo10 [Columba livia]
MSPGSFKAVWSQLRQLPPPKTVFCKNHLAVARTTSGYVQFDSCRFEGGQLQIRAPGRASYRCFSSSPQVIMLRNDVHHCKASGIFLRLSAGGLIADNNIHSNGTAGVDIRKGANPLFCNQIYGNKEAGIYILYNGNPAVSSVSASVLVSGRLSSGFSLRVVTELVAMISGMQWQLEHGLGHRWNVICENQWGGVDICHGGNPVLRSNLISCGYSDGVVVGERGKGLIEGNAIMISHKSIYGVAVFCCKDDAGDYSPDQGGSESFQEEREGAGGENDPDSEEEHPAAQRPISVVLVELNSISHNGEPRSAQRLCQRDLCQRRRVVSVLQGSQLACIANNSISCNSRAGVLVEAECQVELRGSGIYENGSHGITSNGEGVITENDIIDDHRCGLQLLQAAHMKPSGPGLECKCRDEPGSLSPEHREPTAVDSNQLPRLREPPAPGRQNPPSSGKKPG